MSRGRRTIPREQLRVEASRPSQPGVRSCPYCDAPPLPDRFVCARCAERIDRKARQLRDRTAAA